MITRFFSTSKPIHLVLVSVFIFWLFITVRFEYYSDGITILEVFRELSLYGILMLSIVVFSFFVSKNNLTKKNNFKLLIFTLFLACIPETVMHGKMIISNVFILFALRRVLSLRSNLKIKKKLFDAAFWITLASLFYFWSILFFILIIAALFFHGIHQLKNLIIPFTGYLTVFLITISYSVMAPSSNTINWFQIDTVSFDFSNYLLSQVVSITVLTTLGIYSMVFYVRKIGDKSSDFRSSFLLILISLFIGVGLVVIAPVKNTSELLFLFAPLSIIITNHIEAFSNKWLADFYLSVLVVTPFIQLML